MRIIMLFGLTWFIGLTKPIYLDFSVKDIILFFGGGFLIFKSVLEISHKINGNFDEKIVSTKSVSLNSVIWQIVAVDFVFSIDSILTAIGLTEILLLMVIAVVISILFMIFTLAALGLPGTSGFVGEFLILMGAFKDNFLVAVIASLGVIIGAAYMLWLYKRVIFGNLVNSNLKSMVDLNRSELFILTCLAIPTLFFGFYPDPLINTIEVSISDLIETYNYKLVGKF